MLNYTETASRSSIVPGVSVPQSQPHEPHTASPVVEPQASPHWTIGEDFGEWLYKGKRGEIHIPGLIWIGCDAAFAQGFWHGRALMLEHEDGDWNILTDQEFCHLIAQHLPAHLPQAAIAPWKRGFIFGWCLTWHYQPLMEELAEAEEEEAKAAAAGKKRGKGRRSSLPKYPNALRVCIQQAGYTFREVSQETAIPKSTLFGWAAGKRVIPPAERERLAQVIGCTAEELAPMPLVVSV